ncbi:hypothetical protein AVENLUH5627_02905 [Acinetobacter venetianus]|uniref:Lipoprotein n=1 Tax=Acinetobacter venetianus TaxID=52133 RepID=A0A150HKW6_9GAMM|nr:hypothetical protein [Acinetobacter venetianus]KXZ65193.1 hypothetical protein AVENLUH5627_02905 [Acinetobacter venetianus]
MFKKTFLALACSTVLVACGGGGGNSSNNSNSDNGIPVAPKSDLDKAKQLIDTTNIIIAYFDSFDSLQTQYQPTFDAISDAGNDIGNATSLVITLAALAQEDAQGATKEYNAAALEQLLKDSETYDGYYYPDYKLSNNNLNVSVKPDSVTVTGSVNAQYWKDYVWNSQTSTGQDIFGDDATITVSNLKLEAPFTASAKTYNFKITAGSTITTKNKVNEDVSLTFKSDSTAQLAYKNSAPLENQGNTTPETAEFKFSNVVLKAKDVELELTELSSKAKQIQFKNGANTESEIIPSELIFKGKAIAGSENLNLDASIKLNNDLSKVIDVSNGETLTNFINADLNIKLSGNVKGGASAIKPFSVDLTAKRNEYQKGTANIKVSVDKDALTVDLKTDNLIGANPNVSHEPTVSAKISHVNGAFVDIANIDTFTSADIKVGTTKYGTVNKVSGSVYSATFTDNTTKAIAP